MKKISILAVVFICTSIVSFASCKHENLEQWQQVKGLLEMPNVEVASDYYVKDFLRTGECYEEQREALKAFEKDHPEEYSRMKDPIPFIMRDTSEVLIFYTDEKGFVRDTAGKEYGLLENLK